LNVAGLFVLQLATSKRHMVALVRTRRVHEAVEVGAHHETMAGSPGFAAETSDEVEGNDDGKADGNADGNADGDIHGDDEACGKKGASDVHESFHDDAKRDIDSFHNDAKHFEDE
jgi:hypothetical protein